MESFWSRLPKPFFVLAPMADVTDAAYRRLIAEYGKPDITWTEFVSADGLYHTRKMKGMKDEENPLVRDLAYSEAERPVLAQLFTSDPDMMAYAAAFCRELGFDGIDINMGCPDRSIEKQGAGAAMMKDAKRAKEVYRAAASSGLPVSVKTRIGYNAESMDEWLPALLEEKPAALTIHLRTRKEMSKVPAHWELMPKAVALRDSISPATLIIGNGDIADLADATSKVEASGADGAMLGRGIFGNPWLFTGRDPDSITQEEKLEALAKLAEYFSEMSPPKHFAILKKHFKAFVNGFPGAAELRAELMETTDYAILQDTLRKARASA
ncbi:MAG TPA: tRNA-dihydrouridine synthase [Candidatus Paceibacterota bacterium]|nr:tRNA-dihydrouridine synthase [Candidatus Paceibacterota bacterium]